MRESVQSANFSSERELLGFQECVRAIAGQFQIAKSCCSKGIRRKRHEIEPRQFHHAPKPLPHRHHLLGCRGE